MKQKEEINQLIESLRGVEPIEPSPFMFAKIKHKIAQRQSVPQEFDTRLVQKFSFALLLIVALNISVIYYYSLQSSSEITATTTTAVESDQYIATTDNYYYNY